MGQQEESYNNILRLLHTLENMSNLFKMTCVIDLFFFLFKKAVVVKVNVNEMCVGIKQIE